MFTGIVEEVGEVRGIDLADGGARLTIGARQILDGATLGDSIAVAGVCLTLTEHDEGSFTVDAMAETLAATTVGTWVAGTRVNLERALAATGRLGGHIVQGHVDAVARVVAHEHTPRWDDLTIDLPAGLARYVVAKGSIALDGVSLTAQHVDGSQVTVSLIPATLAATTLGELRVGDAVNVEVDILAKYVEGLLGDRVATTTEQEV